MSSASTKPASDRRIYLGETIINDLRQTDLPADPRHFEFWFTYRSGRNSALNAAADAIRAKRGALAPSDIDHFYDQYLSPWRVTDGADAVVEHLGEELQGLTEALEAAIGSTLAQRETMIAETNNLSIATALTLQRVLSTIDRLMQTSKEGQVRNAVLEAKITAASREIGSLRKQLDAVRNQCQADPLTSLPGPAVFDRSLAQAIEESAATRQPLALALCGLDQFTAFNETFGTHVGDQVMRSIGVLLRAQMRPGDLVARFHGDQFAVIMPQSRAADAVRLADRFRQVVQAHELIKHPNGSGRLTASVGVAEWIKGDTPEFLLRRASDALKVAKQDGRNRIIEMTLDGPVWGDLS